MIDPDELDRIKAATATYLAERLPNHKDELREWSGSVIVGTMNAIDSAVNDDLDPQAFTIGRRVRSLMADTPENLGTVTKAVSADGELHTVWVRWDGWASAIAVGPSQLELVR